MSYVANPRGVGLEPKSWSQFTGFLNLPILCFLGIFFKIQHFAKNFEGLCLKEVYDPLWELRYTKIGLESNMSYRIYTRIHRHLGKQPSVSFFLTSKTFNLEEILQMQMGFQSHHDKAYKTKFINELK